MDPLRFLGIWASVCLGLLALVAAFNFLIDPYCVWGTPTIAGLDRDKPGAIDNPFLAKPYAARRVHPATVILGSSRFDIGIDPEAPVWPAASQPVFNLAIPGTGPRDQERLLTRLLATDNPRLIVIGMTFDDNIYTPDHILKTGPEIARANAEPVVGGEEDGDAAPRDRAGVASDLATSLLSLSAIEDSVGTVLHQGSADTSYMTRFGWNTGGLFRDLVRHEGELSLFLHKSADKARKYLRVARHPEAGGEDDLARMLSDAKKHGAEAIVMIPPGHADEAELIRQSGLLPLRQLWLRRIAAAVDRARQEGGRVRLWDFSIPGRYLTEPLPAAGDKTTQTRYFWETVHFKSALGEMMVSRAMGGGPEDFGVQIDSDGLDAHFAAFAGALARYEAERPEDVARVTRLIDAAKATLCATDPEDCGAAVASR
jgi:hypothetical protein